MSKSYSREIKNLLIEAAQNGDLNTIQSRVYYPELDEDVARNIMVEAVIAGQLEIIKYMYESGYDLYDRNGAILILARNYKKDKIVEHLEKTMRDPMVIELSRRKHTEKLQQENHEKLDKLFERLMEGFSAFAKK